MPVCICICYGGEQITTLYLYLLWRNEIVANLYLFLLWRGLQHISIWYLSFGYMEQEHVFCICFRCVRYIEVLEVMLTSLLLVTSLTGTLKCEFDLIT